MGRKKEAECEALLSDTGSNRESNGSNVLLDSVLPVSGLPGFSLHGRNRRSSLFMGIGGVAFSLANATVGAGIIGLPFAFKQAGLAVGLVLVIWVALLTNLSLNLMIHAGRLTGHLQYAQLAQHALGYWLGSFAVNASVIGNGVGSMISYLIIMGDSLELVVKSLFQDMINMDGWQRILLSRYFLISSAALIVLLPLLLFCRNISRHPVISSIGVLVLPLIILIVFIRVFILPLDEAGTGSEVGNVSLVGSQLFSAIGVMAFAFVSNHAAFNAYESLRKPSLVRWLQSTSLGVGVSLLASGTFAVIGYLAFGDKVKGNLLLNFSTDDRLINFGRMGLAVNMIATFPTQFVPVRAALVNMFGGPVRGSCKKTLSDYMIDLAVFIPILAVSTVIRDLGAVFALVGAVCATWIAYILPALMYLSVTQEARRRDIEDFGGLSGWLFRPMRYILVEGNNDADGTDNGDCSQKGAFVTVRPEESDSGDDQEGGSGNRERHSIPSSPRLDAMAFVLLIFGFFAMLTSTFITLYQIVKGSF